MLEKYDIARRKFIWYLLIRKKLLIVSKKDDLVGSEKEKWKKGKVENFFACTELNKNIIASVKIDGKRSNKIEVKV